MDFAASTVFHKHELHLHIFAFLIQNGRQIHIYILWSIMGQKHCFSTNQVRLFKLARFWRVRMR